MDIWSYLQQPSDPPIATNMKKQVIVNFVHLLCLLSHYLYRTNVSATINRNSPSTSFEEFRFYHYLSTDKWQQSKVQQYQSDENKIKFLQSERDLFEKQLIESFNTHKRLTNVLEGIKEENTTLKESLAKKEDTIKQLQSLIDAMMKSNEELKQSEREKKEYEVLDIIFS